MLIYYGKQWYYGQNYGIMDETMVLWKKLLYYGQNYDTIPKTMEIWFTMEKLWYYMGKKTMAL